MAAIVGALRAVLSLDSAAFSKGVKAAQGSMKGLRLSMRNVGKGLQVAGAGLTAASVAVAAAVRGQINAADDMSKAAQKFGVPIETLSKLSHAADMSGVSFETLGTGLRKLSQNMADAAAGNKTAAALFDDIGVSAVNADGTLRSAEAVMQDIADVLSKMPDGAAKTALAMDLFGKSGAEMIPMLNGGSGALGEMMREAESLGIVFDAKTGKAAENFNDNISRIKGALEGLVVQLAVALVPTLESLSGTLVDATKWFRDLSPEVQSLSAKIAILAMAAGPLAIGLGWVVSSLGAIVGAMKAIAAVALANPLVLLGAAAVAAAAVIYMNWGAIKQWFIDLWAAITEAAQATWDAIKAMATAARDWTVDAWNGIRDAIAEKLATVSEAFVDAWEAIKAEVGSWPGRFVEFGHQIVEGLKQGIMEKWDSMVDGLRSQWDGLKDSFAEALGIKSPSRVFRGYGRNISEGLALGITDQQPMVGQAMDGVIAGLDGSGQSLASRMDSLKSTFEGAFVGLVTGALSFKDALRQVAQQLAQMAAKAAFNSLFGSLFGGGGGGGFKLFANGAAFDRGRVTAFAKGGIVAGATAFAMPSGLGVMGEAGPEAIMPLQRGADGSLGVVAQGGAAGMVRIVIEEAPGFAAKVRAEAQGVAVQVVQAYDQEALAGRVDQTSRDPRGRG